MGACPHPPACGAGGGGVPQPPGAGFAPSGVPQPGGPAFAPGGGGAPQLAWPAPIPLGSPAPRTQSGRASSPKSDPTESVPGAYCACGVPFMPGAAGGILQLPDCAPACSPAWSPCIHPGIGGWDCMVPMPGPRGAGSSCMPHRGQTGVPGETTWPQRVQVVTNSLPLQATLRRARTATEAQWGSRQQCAGRAPALATTSQPVPSVSPSCIARNHV